MAEKVKSPVPQIILWVLLTISAFLLGSLYTKVQYLKNKNAKTPEETQVTQQVRPAQSAVSLDQVKDAFNKSFVKFGDTQRKMVLIEIGDPSCPYCHVAAGLDGELNKQMGTQFMLVADGGTYVAPVPAMRKFVESGKAAFAYLYTPGHGNGEMGMKALYCAFDKGKFWEVHDVLMTKSGYSLLNDTVRNDKTKSGELADFLKSVFDPAQMKACLESDKYDARLREDIRLSSVLGVTGTPGFFINETLFAGAYSYKDMEPAFTAALK